MADPVATMIAMAVVAKEDIKEVETIEVAIETLVLAVLIRWVPIETIRMQMLLIVAVDSIKTDAIEKIMTITTIIRDGLMAIIVVNLALAVVAIEVDQAVNTTTKDSMTIEDNKIETI